MKEAPRRSSRSTAPEPVVRRGGSARLLLGLVLMALALVVLGRQIAHAGPFDVARRVADASLPWLAAVTLLTASRFVVFAARLAAITRRLVPCGTRSFFPIVMASQLVALCFPGLRAGAAYLRAHLAARRFGGGTALHIGPNIIDQVTSGLAWLLVAVVLTPFLVDERPGESTSGLAVWLIAALVATGVAGWALHRFGPDAIAWLERPRTGRRGRLASASSRAFRGAGALAREPRALAAGLAGGAAFLILTGGAQWAALRAIDAPAPFWLAVVAVTLGSAAGTLAHTPGGLGVTEAAQVAFLSGQGLSPEAAASGVLLARSVHYVIVLAGGGAAMAREWTKGRLRGLFGGAGGTENGPVPPHAGPPGGTGRVGDTG